jgi:hypothetical protein
VVGQGIIVDFGFIFQKSNNVECMECLHSFNVGTAYLLLVGHCTNMMWGIVTYFKGPPLTWTNCWVAQYKPAGEKSFYAVVDGGGEISNNTQVQSL